MKPSCEKCKYRIFIYCGRSNKYVPKEIYETCYLLEKHKLEVRDITMSVNDGYCNKFKKSKLQLL